MVPDGHALVGEKGSVPGRAERHRIGQDVGGLLDDVLNIKPYQKLFGQLIGATIIVGVGPRLPITGYELVDIWITVFWLIGSSCPSGNT